MRKLGVIVLSIPELGGSYQYSLSMLQALRHVSGYEITVYGDPRNRDLVKLGFPIQPMTESRWRRVCMLIAYKANIRLRQRFEANDILLAPMYSLALLHYSKPFIYTLHDLQERYYPRNFSWLVRYWRNYMNTQMLTRTSVVVCESNHVKSDIVRFFGANPQQIAVIPAPPLEQIAPEMDPMVLESLRQRLGLPDRFIFYPAQFWPHKNHMRLVEAFREVVAEIPDLKLVFTGNKRGEYENVFRAVRDFGLADHVMHLGYLSQQDVQMIYRLAAALIMPSLFESVSIPIYEAFQAGTPVAASGILAMPEQIGDAGLTFDPTSVQSMKSAILGILQNPGRARALADLGRRKMEQMTLERYGSQLQELLDAAGASKAQL